MNPFFSIVIPTYNRALLVQESIHSVLAQSFDDFEIIVVDDGSTDNTESVIKSISSPRLFYFKKQNAERGAARNFGIAKASGQYICFLDSDDKMLNNHLEVLHSHLKEYKEDFIATKYFFFNENSKIITRDIQKLPAGHHDFKTFLIGNPLACCFTVRRDNANLIRFREELSFVIMEDWIFLMENLSNSKLHLMPDITMGIRDHDLRSMKGNSDKIINARVNALDHLLQSGKFSERDEKILIGNSNYFCAVHAYIGNQTKAGFRYLQESVTQTGLSIKVILLFLKLSLQLVWRSRKSKEF